MKHKSNLNYIIGIIPLLTALFIKSFLNHNIRYWTFIKYTTILLSVFGILALIYPMLSKGFKKPNKSFSKLPKDWIIYYSKKGSFLLFPLLILIGIENLGKLFNYKIREYYLSNETITKDAVIEDYVRFYMPKVEDVDFYLIKFEINNQSVEKGLLVDYYKKDGILENEKIKFENNKLEVETIKGRQVKIIYSKKFPSFLKIID